MATKTTATIILILFTLGITFPVWCVDFFYHDDAFFGLKSQSFGFFGAGAMMLDMGRWVGAWFMSVIGWGINDVGSLKFLRLFNVITFVYLGYLIFSLWRNWLKDVHALLASMLLLTLPSFVVPMVWAANAPVAPAMILAFFSAQIAVHLRRETVVKQMISVGLLVLSLAIYQPSAMMFWPIVAVHLCLNKNNRRHVLFNSLRVAFVAFVLYGLALMAYRQFLLVEVPQVGYGTSFWQINLLEQLAWFVNGPISIVLRTWNMADRFFPWWMWALFLMSCAVCVLVWARSLTRIKNGFNYILMIVALFCFLVLSFLPNLVTDGRMAFDRCLGVLTFTVFFIFLTALRQLCLTLKGLGDQLLTLVLSCLMVCNALQVIDHVMRLRVIPSVQEYHYIQGILEALPMTRYTNAHIIRRDKTSYVKRNDEWGTLSLDFLFDSLPVFALLAKSNSAQIPLYITSQLPCRPVDYISIKTLNYMSHDKELRIREVGQQNKLVYYHNDIYTSRMRHFKLREFTYFFFFYGLRPDAGQIMLINMNDL